VSRYALTHLPDSVLLHDLKALLAQERTTTATLLAHLAEVDARRLYAPAGYPSMFAYCLEELHLSEETACKRIRAARAARQFPAVYALLADGRLHLTAVVMLAPYLTPENADGLLAAATHQSKARIEQLLAERFPRPDLPERIQVLAPPLTIGLPSPGTVKSLAPGEPPSPGTVEVAGNRPAWGPGEQAELVESPSPGTVRARVTPLAPGRYALQFTFGEDAYEKFRYAQALLGHAVPSGELAVVFERALDALIGRLERQKFAATSRPRRRRPSANARHVPAAVRREVWERDGGQCTFVSAAGRRCPARTRLEYDHVEPVARGGRATVGQIRLRCRVHNEYAAECAFGADFMSRKREAAQHEAAQRAAAQQAAEEARLRAAAAERERARAAAAASAEEARARAAEEARVRAAAAEEVVPWLRALGLRADEARQAAAGCETIPDAPLEERVRYALSCSARPARGRAARIPRPAGDRRAGLSQLVRGTMAIEAGILGHATAVG
jgi:hypothetical protein